MNNWDQVLEKLKNITSAAAFEGYLRNMKFLEKKGNTILIGVFNDVVLKRIREKHQDLILDYIRDIPEWANVDNLDFRVNEEYDEEIDETIKEEEKNVPDFKPSEDSTFSQKYTFENFVTGKSNEFADAACVAVAKNPGKTYNPLFLYGGAGLGKTHLMKAIASEVIKKTPQPRIVYVSSEQFTNEFIRSLMEKKQYEFKNKFRQIDLLLIDDIQFLEKKEGTIEEFFHTFNDLFEHGKQIVVSSDRPPIQLGNLEERLISRFESGLIADIQTPDLELREAILRREAEKKGVVIEDECVVHLAKKIVSNIRKLEGAFIRVCAYASMNNIKITTKLMDEVLRDMVTTNQKRISIEEIQRAVASYFGVKLTGMKEKNRSQNISFPRQIAMYLSREFTNESLPAIGKSFGGRDHTTVMHACSKISEMLKTDLEFKKELENIIKQFNG
ncbi:MAG: chromosomal replication initiator protein DnaA [Candidatus Wallbacteria bacterium]|nr:chromosomal replication initiator protein DnaA [Candidatus Wallbacteria bacterium]